MALSRANVEAILIRRVGRLMVAADMDGTTVDGTNGDINDPLAWAIVKAGGTVDSRVAVDDDDVARIGEDAYDKLLDLAELRLLETIQGNYYKVDSSLDNASKKWGQLSGHIASALARKAAQVQRDYSIGLGTLESGVISLGFQTTVES